MISTLIQTVLKDPTRSGRLPSVIDEGWGQKPGQRPSHIFGGKMCSISCRASCFASVDFEERVEFILFFQIDRAKKKIWTNKA